MDDTRSDARADKAATGTPIALGPWRIDTVAREVSGPAGVRRLEPKPMALLAHLARRPGVVVSRHELLATAWGDEMATDDVLSRAISELRRALGDDPRTPRFLETIRGAGYRLVVPEAPAAVDSVPAATAAHPARVRWARGAGVAVVAVVALVLVILGSRLFLLRDERTVAGPDPHFVSINAMPGEYSGPRYSPDGTRLAAAWTSQDQSTSGLYVQAADGANRLQIVSGAVRSPAWSPDATHIAYLATDAAGRHSISEVSSLGGTPRALMPIPVWPVLGVDWSPEGSQLAFSSHDAPFGVFKIRLLSHDSLRVRTLTHGGAGAVGDAYPAFSPDGRYLAFARFLTESAADIYVVDMASESETRITFDDRTVTALAFAPDSRSLVFASDRDGGSAVWRVSVEGGPASRVVGSDRRVTGLTYPRGRGDLVASAAEREQQLWVVAVQRGGAQPAVVAVSRADELPSVAPDGRRMAFVSRRTGTSEVWLARLDGDSALQVTHGDGFASTPSWSPDGARLAVERRVSGKSELWIADVSRGTAGPIATSLTMPFSPTWARDGKSLIAAARDSGVWNLWRVPLAGGAPARITTAGGLHGVEAPDGHSLLLTKASAAGLWSRDLRSGAERLTVPDVPAGDWSNWAVARHGVAYVSRDSSGAQQLMFADLDGSQRRSLARAVRMPAGSGGVSLSPDGTMVVFGQAGRSDGQLYRLAIR